MNRMEYKEVQGWCSMISQTGTDLRDICFLTGLKPSVIITNNYNKISKINLDFFIKLNIPIIIIPKPTQEEYLHYLNLYNINLITLNGYLKIVPESVISFVNGEIYNLHPGFITKYPELKGLDPQIRTFENLSKYSEVGCVLHKVIPAVDEGEILYSKSVRSLYIKSLDDLFIELKNISIELWLEFFKNYKNK